MTPRPDGDELGNLQLPSFGVRRIQAAVVGDRENPAHTVKLIDLARDDVAGYVREILAFDPELIGFSIFVWSTPTLVAVAREVKRRKPGCVIVFGGPSARPALFDLGYYRSAHAYLDALVEGDGEIIFREIAALADLSHAALQRVAGLTLPTEHGWHRTAARSGLTDLDSLPSPFQLGLMPAGAVAYVETYRGCPMSCRFCEWGKPEAVRALFSADYIAAELRAFEKLKAPAVFLLDAGLNLNIRGFRNLREAHRRSGFLKNTLFWAEVYPSVIRDEHFEFLHEIGPAYLGVGMQSMDPMVLKLHERPQDSPRFEELVRALATVTNIELQIIFALPGDTPDGFRRTLDYALSLPASLRVYHCLVLPDALMTRGLPDWNMRFDARNLAMISCKDWSEETIAAMRGELDRLARARRGRLGQYWWSFPGPHRATAMATPA